MGSPEVITVAIGVATGIKTTPSKIHQGRHARTLDFSAFLPRNLGLPETLVFGKATQMGSIQVACHSQFQM